MNRRDVLVRIESGTVVVLAAGAFGGCLTVESGTEGDEDGEAVVTSTSSQSSTARGGTADGRDAGDPGDRDGVVDREPHERRELGDLEAVDEPAVLLVHNDDERERSVDLAVTLAEGDDEFEESFEVPAGEVVEVAIGDPEGYDLVLEADGASTQTSVRRSGGDRQETTVTLTASGVEVETRSRG